MRRLVFSLLVLFSLNSYADDSESLLDEVPVSVGEGADDKKTELSKDDKIEESFKNGLKDPSEKEAKINKCIDEYIKKQSRPYTKATQDNLYDLIHNFDKVASKIYGKKSTENDVPREEKIESLAKVQCELYFSVGVLK